MRVCFDGGELNERGVAVAMCDYAQQAQALLGVDATILYDTRLPVLPAALQRFQALGPTLGYDSEDARQRLLERNKADVSYHLKVGRQPIAPSKSCRTAVHEVFKFFKPHGDAYAYVSPWLAQEMAANAYPCVPHMVALPTPTGDLRAALNIPRQAFVIGRHGGFALFDVPFVPAAIQKALQKRSDLWFVFLNTQPFLRHERVIYLPATADRQAIANFVATCDAGINARRVGETFGLAIGEFLAQDKPVLVWEGGRDRNHLDLVGAQGLRYRRASDLLEHLLNLQKAPSDGRYVERVMAFQPKAVMATFAQVFLLGTSNHVSPLARMALKARARVRALTTARLQRLQDHFWIVQSR